MDYGTSEKVNKSREREKKEEAKRGEGKQKTRAKKRVPGCENKFGTG